MKYTKIRKVKSQSDEKIYLRNNKKVRGLPRLVKGINLWTNRNLDLNIEYLKNRERYYLKLYFSPFYNLFYQKNPPHWYKILIVKSLLMIYNNWSKTLKELNIDSYLNIWIMDNEFMQSQVVVAIGDEIDYYDSLFLKRDKENYISLLNSFYTKYPFFKDNDIKIEEHVAVVNTVDDELSNTEIKILKNKLVEERVEKNNSISYYYVNDIVYLCASRGFL